MNFLVRKNHFSLHCECCFLQLQELVLVVWNVLNWCELSCYIILDLWKASNYHKLYKAKEERGKTKQNQKMRIHSLDVRNDRNGILNVDENLDVILLKHHSITEYRDLWRWLIQFFWAGSRLSKDLIQITLSR